MGLRIDPPPIDYGNDCITCTPALWAPGKTPSKIYCSFWGITGCGVSPYAPPNGQIFVMDQVAMFPCHWSKTTGAWRPDFIVGGFDGIKSRLRLFDKFGFSFFTDDFFQCRPEYHRYSNDQGACLFAWAGAGGYGCVFWLDFIHELISHAGFETSDDIFYEFRSINQFYTVHKLCDLYHRTNVLVKKIL